MPLKSATEVADYLILLADRDETGNRLTPMQLLKLVYLCHGWMLGIYNRGLISDRIEAWQYGPVIPDLYQEFKSFRSQPVIKDVDDAVKSPFGTQESSIIDQVYQIYGHRDGVYLSSLTHQPGTPWDLTWKLLPNCSAPISNDLIENHFKSLAAA